jgi:hypothetical protein
MPMTQDRNHSTVTSRMKGRVGYLKIYSTAFDCYYAEVQENAHTAHYTSLHENNLRKVIK